MNTFKLLTAALLGLAVGAASAQGVAGTCTPSVVDMGVITAPTTRAFTTCAPLTPVTSVSNQVDYTASFEFQLTSDAFFYSYVQGTSVFPNQLLPYWSGVGIMASLYYGDQLVISDQGRGIGSSEGPAILNPQFNAGFGNADGSSPAGAYQIRVRGTGFGPIPEGTISAQIFTTYKPDTPVTPVPEPLTVAMQAVGAFLLAMLAIRRRRATSDLSH